MIKHFQKATKQTAKEAKWWAWAAWTLPFLALAILSFETFIGLETLFTKSLVIISVTFFTISVYWWWWALNKIKVLMASFYRTEKHFEEVKDELKKTRDVLRGE